MGGKGNMTKWVVFLIALLFPLASWCQSGDLFEPLPEKGKPVDWSKMHFTLRTEKGHRNVLFMWGQINEGDAQQFRLALDAAKAGELWLFSGGGDMYEAMEIARIVRSYKITTRVRRGAACISACNFIFLGGVVRYVETGADFESHMFASPPGAIRLRARILYPPQDILTFTQRYPQHFPIIAKAFEGLAEVLHKDKMEKDKQQKDVPPAVMNVPNIEPEILDWVVKEYTDNHQGEWPLWCPGAKVDQAGKLEQPGLNAAQPVSNPSSPQSAVADQEKERNKPVEDIANNPCAQDFLRTYLRTEAAQEEAKGTLQQAAQASATVALFLTEMSVSLRFMTEFSNIHNDQPRKLTHAELRSLNIVNAD
jgi:hypothetical protein